MFLVNVEFSINKRLKMKKLFTVLSLFILVLLISGCSVVPIGLTYSSTPLDNPMALIAITMFLAKPRVPGIFYFI